MSGAALWGRATIKPGKCCAGEREGGRWMAKRADDATNDRVGDSGRRKGGWGRSVNNSAKWTAAAVSPGTTPSVGRVGSRDQIIDTLLSG